MLPRYPPTAPRHTSPGQTDRRPTVIHTFTDAWLTALVATQTGHAEGRVSFTAKVGYALYFKAY